MSRSKDNPRGAEIHRPKPFTRDLYHSGNRMTLKFDKASATCCLTKSQMDEWDSPLTCDLFRRAAKSIIRERAKAEGTAVILLDPAGQPLFKASILKSRGRGPLPKGPQS